MFRILNTLKKTLATEPEKEQFVNFKRNSIKKVSLADIFLKLMQKNGKDVEIKRINKLEYVYEKLTGYYFLISSEKVADYYDYNIKIFHKKLFPNGVIEKIEGNYYSSDYVKEKAEYLLNIWIETKKLDFYTSLLDIENLDLKMESLKIGNKRKLIIYEDIKTSYIKDYNLYTEKSLYSDILLEDLKEEPLYDKIEYNEFFRNISPLIENELLDTTQNYKINILVYKYPITDSKMQALDDELDIRISKNNSTVRFYEHYPEIYFRNTVNLWKKSDFLKSREQNVFIINIELNKKKWEKIPQLKKMLKIEHKKVFSPVFKRMDNNTFDIVYIPRDWDDYDYGFTVSGKLLEKMLALGYDVEIISNKERWFGTHEPYKIEKEEDILWIYDYENGWYILPLLDLDTIERTLLDGEIVTCTTTSIQVYHEKYCPEGKLYFQKSISDDGIGASIYYGFGEWVVNEYKNLIKK